MTPQQNQEIPLVGEVLHITFYDEFSAFTVAKLLPVPFPENSYHPDASKPRDSSDRKLGQYSNISQFAIVESRELSRCRGDTNFRERAPEPRSKESCKNKCCNLDERDCRDVVNCDDSIACYGRGASRDRSVIAARSNCSSYSRTVPKPVTIVGALPLIQIGQKVRCTGSWVVDPRHGKQFSVTNFSYELPTHPTAIKRLIGSGFLEGVGNEFAERIVTRFGTGTFRMLDEEPERLLEVPGMGKKRADKIIKCWKQRTNEQEFFLLLTSWGISHTIGLRILRRWGSEAISVLKQNPFQLAKEIQGVGFQIADKIAEKLGIPLSSPIRVDAAIEFFLWELSSEGHTAIPLTLFVERASEKLGIDHPQLSERIDALVKRGELVLFPIEAGKPPHLCLKKLFAYEQQIVKNIQRLNTSTPRLRPVNTEKAICWAEEKLHMSFAAGQKEALACALDNKCCIITGGPGTGKSTITRAIVNIYGKLTTKIFLAAPTGKAAKRLHEVTGRYSQTIHRLLKWDPLGGAFTHNRDKPLSADLLIIDEASMIDTFLIYALLEAIPNHAKVIIIGDVDQLPSIGPGAILEI